MSIPPTASRLLRWQDRHPVLTDSAVALLLLVFTCVIGFSQTPPFPLWSWAPASLVAMAPATAGLCLRRRYPITAWAAVVIAPAVEMLGASLLSGLDASALPQLLDFYMIFGAPLCLAAIAMRHHARWAFAAAFVSAAPTVLAERWVGYTSRDYLVFEYVALTLFGIIGVLVGLLLKVQRAQLQEFETRSTRLALAREQAAMLAAANERSRIAREMHDVVAHSLAVMITMADGAAATVERNPAVAKQAMETLAEAGRSALADTRRLVGVLREDPSVADGPTTDLIGSTDPEPAASSQSPEPPALSTASASSAHSHEVRDVPVPEFAPLGTVTPVEPSAPIASLRQQATDGGGDRSQGDLPLAPAPEQADITELVRRFEAAGVPVSYRWVGTALPEDKSLQLTVFRIAQEALTNVLRYAPTTPAVSVDVERHIGTVVLTVDNEAAPGTRPMHGSGKGLIGMRERASVYGGTVQAGPTPTGWRVRAVLRWDEHDEGTSSWQMPL